MHITVNNWAMFMLSILALLMLLERIINRYMTEQVTMNLKEVYAGRNPPYHMAQWRKAWYHRRAARTASGLALASFLILSAVAHHAQGAERASTQSADDSSQGQLSFSKRNVLLARAEKQARAGNKGLMRANISYARRYGPVDILMVARIESLLAH
jgi:hypothetical protein